MSRSLVLLSGEGTTIPEAEARALFLTYDRDSMFESPEPRVLLVRTKADPFAIAARVAFARRIGLLVSSPTDANPLLAGHTFRFRCVSLRQGGEAPDPASYLEGVDSAVDLRDPDYELTLVRGRDDYIALTAPGRMSQAWSERRPRSRAFFHPSAIFPKLSRALANLSRCREGGLFLEPFIGTGSIAIEASLMGAKVVGVDLSDRMCRGALANMKHFGQDWLGILRADSSLLPLRRVNAVATDIPYGRVSSTRGRQPKDTLRLLLPTLAEVMGSGSFVVLMHPQEVSVEPGSDFSLEEEHHLHVHKLLTRTITILRRR